MPTIEESRSLTGQGVPSIGRAGNEGLKDGTEMAGREADPTKPLSKGGFPVWEGMGMGNFSQPEESCSLELGPMAGAGRVTIL